MNKNLKIGLIIVGIVIVFIASGIIFNSWKDAQNEKTIIELTVAKETIKNNAVKITDLQLSKDTLSQSLAISQAKLEQQKNNPTIIINKYATIHADIEHLDALNSIKLFSDNETIYLNNKIRYSGKRSNRNN